MVPTYSTRTIIFSLHLQLILYDMYQYTLDWAKEISNWNEIKLNMPLLSRRIRTKSSLSHLTSKKQALGKNWDYGQSNSLKTKQTLSSFHVSAQIYILYVKAAPALICKERPQSGVGGLFRQVNSKDWNDQKRRRQTKAFI